jgi:hypothetical protein
MGNIPNLHSRYPRCNSWFPDRLSWMRSFPHNLPLNSVAVSIWN